MSCFIHTPFLIVCVLKSQAAAMHSSPRWWPPPLLPDRIGSLILRRQTAHHRGKAESRSNLSLPLRTRQNLAQRGLSKSKQGNKAIWIEMSRASLRLNKLDTHEIRRASTLATHLDAAASKSVRSQKTAKRRGSYKSWVCRAPLTRRIHWRTPTQQRQKNRQ